MSEYIPNREEAYELLTEHIKSESLLRHSLSVESAMAHFAELFNEDVEKWSIIGLLHDLDYEKYPEEHCVKVVDMLESEKYPNEYIKSITSHGYGICEGVFNAPEHKMEKVLYMVDELTGLITACVLVRPSKSVLDLKPKSVTKKWKDKNFAAGVNRETIERGLEMLDMDRREAIDETIKALSKAAERLDLKGNL